MKSLILTEYENKFTEKYFKKLNPLAYLAGYVFASGCALSGAEEFKADVNEANWHPNHFSCNIASFGSLKL